MQKFTNSVKHFASSAKALRTGSGHFR